MGSRIALPSITRPNATTTGDSSWTEILMKKYGTPQMIPRAANAPQPRQLTGFAFLYAERLICRMRNAIRD